MTRISATTGSEGPSHDPYSYDEMTVQRDGKQVVGHFGLATWVEVNGVRVAENDDAQCAAAFERESGLTLKAFQKAYLRIKYTCKCGCNRTRSESGMPGESFNVCARCGEIVSSNFHLSEII